MTAQNRWSQGSDVGEVEQAMQESDSETLKRDVTKVEED